METDSNSYMEKAVIIFILILFHFIVVYINEYIFKNLIN